MQWAADGKPTWRAPRLLAALLTPAIAVFMFAITVAPALAHNDIGDPVVLGVLTLEAALLLVTHALHLHFALRDVLGLNKR